MKKKKELFENVCTYVAIKTQNKVIDKNRACYLRQHNLSKFSHSSLFANIKNL